MATRKRFAQVQLSRDIETDRPIATIYAPADITMAELSGVHSKLFTDIFKKQGKGLGLVACEGCRSGLDKLILKDILTIPAEKGLAEVKVSF
jgi:hypothetical protein